MTRNNTYELTDPDYKLFQEYINRESGLVFNDSTRNSLRISLIARMRYKGFDNYEQYYKYMVLHPDGPTEFRNLITLLTINETSFFRNASHFDVLGEHIIPELLNMNIDKNISIWSAGCSTGEEPYSIAIALQETLRDIDDWNVEILATDIDKKALARAMEGIYKPKALRNTDDKYINKYFEKNDKFYRIGDRVKNMVSFDYINLADNIAPLPLKGSWDIIFCRNVLIYFKPELIETIIKGFSDSMKDNGYLFIGFSEMLAGNNKSFRPARFDEVFVYKKQGALAAAKKQDKKLSPAINVQHMKEEASRAHLEERERANSLYSEAFEIFIKEDFDTALEKVKESLKLDPFNPYSLILSARIYFEREQYVDAWEACDSAINLAAFLAEAHYILGIVYEKYNLIEHSVRELNKSIELKPSFIMARFALARIVAESDKKSAIQQYKEAIRICSEKSPDEFVDFSGGFTCRPLIDLCKKKIKRIK